MSVVLIYETAELPSGDPCSCRRILADLGDSYSDRCARMDARRGAFLWLKAESITEIWAWATLLLGLESFAWPVVLMIQLGARQNRSLRPRWDQFFQRLCWVCSLPYFGFRFLMACSNGRGEQINPCPTMRHSGRR